jgi:hypothetical protein
MDTAAEFTLQIARFAQDRFVAPRSAARWYIMPWGKPLTWAAARDALAAFPKPALVAPLTEPGTLGVWLPKLLDEEGRAWFEYQLGNQMSYWQEKLKVCGVSETDPVVFEPATPALALTGREFLQWVAEYVIGVPVTMIKIADGKGGRFLLMAPGGGGPPLGMHDPYAPAS